MWLLLACGYRTVAYGDGSASEVCVVGDTFDTQFEDWTGTLPTPEVEFSSFGGARVLVFFHHAISECDEVAASDCRIAFDGNDAFIEASATINFHKDRTDCDGTIRPAFATCDSPSLDDGEWTFHYDDLTIPITVPGSPSFPCVTPTLATCATTSGTAAWPSMLVPFALWLRRRRFKAHRRTQAPGREPQKPRPTRTRSRSRFGALAQRSFWSFFARATSIATTRLTAYTSSFSWSNGIGASRRAGERERERDE